MTSKSVFQLMAAPQPMITRSMVPSSSAIRLLARDRHSSSAQPREKPILFLGETWGGSGFSVLLLTLVMAAVMMWPVWPEHVVVANCSSDAGGAGLRANLVLLLGLKVGQAEAYIAEWSIKFYYL